MATNSTAGAAITAPARHDTINEVRAELRRLRRQATRDGVDPAWRQVACDLADALRPYTMFREQTVQDGRIVVHTAVPGSTLRHAREALEALARMTVIESYRESGVRLAGDGSQER